MEVTRKLMDEHQLILAYIAYLEKFTADWHAGRIDDEKAFGIMVGVVGFIREYADTYHHAKEETILFRHLEAPGVLSHCNPLPVMLSDHDLGRQYVAGILRGIEAQDRQEVIANTREWSDHLASHIYKEDNVLYPMAEEGLDESSKGTIAQEYAAAESRLGGASLEQNYRALLKKMES